MQLPKEYQGYLLYVLTRVGKAILPCLYWKSGILVVNLCKSQRPFNTNFILPHTSKSKVGAPVYDLVWKFLQIDTTTRTDCKNTIHLSRTTNWVFKVEIEKKILKKLVYTDGWRTRTNISNKIERILLIFFNRTPPVSFSGYYQNYWRNEFLQIQMWGILENWWMDGL